MAVEVKREIVEARGFMGVVGQGGERKRASSERSRVGKTVLIFLSGCSARTDRMCGVRYGGSLGQP